LTSGKFDPKKKKKKKTFFLSKEEMEKECRRECCDDNQFDVFSDTPSFMGDDPLSLDLEVDKTTSTDENAIESDEKTVERRPQQHKSVESLMLNDSTLSAMLFADVFEWGAQQEQVESEAVARKQKAAKRVCCDGSDETRSCPSSPCADPHCGSAACKSLSCPNSPCSQDCAVIECCAADATHKSNASACTKKTKKKKKKKQKKKTPNGSAPFEKLSPQLLLLVSELQQLDASKRYAIVDVDHLRRVEQELLSLREQVAQSRKRSSIEKGKELLESEQNHKRQRNY
jgi:hypothetical protein